MKATLGEAQDWVESLLAGKIEKDDRGCILWPFSCTNGYPQIWSYRLSRPVKVGALVLEHFVGPRQPGYTIGHAPHYICGNRNCVSPAHLSWQTYAEQGQNRRIDNGTDLIDEVRELLRSGMKQKEAAARVGIHESTISQWKRRGHL